MKVERKISSDKKFQNIYLEAKIQEMKGIES